jgi:hypothetical protein
MMKEFVTSAQDLHEHLCSINGMSAFHKRRCLSDGPIVSTRFASNIYAQNIRAE